MSWTRHGADHCPWVGVWQFFLQLEPQAKFRLQWNLPCNWSPPERKCVLEYYRDVDASCVYQEEQTLTFELSIDADYVENVANHEGGLERWRRQTETTYARQLGEVPGYWTQCGLSPFAENAPLFKQHRLHEDPENFANNRELFCYVVEEEGWYIKQTIVTSSTITSSV